MIPIQFCPQGVICPLPEVNRRVKSRKVLYKIRDKTDPFKIYNKISVLDAEINLFAFVTNEGYEYTGLDRRQRGDV